MPENIYVRVEPRDVNYINRIMEGYEHLGLVSTLNSKEGLLVIRVTPDTYQDVLAIITNLPICVELV